MSQSSKKNHRSKKVADMADRLHSAAPPTFSGGCGCVIRQAVSARRSCRRFCSPVRWSSVAGRTGRSRTGAPPHHETHRPRSRALWSSLPLEAEDKRRMLLEASAKGTKILQQGRKRRVQSLTGALRSLNELGRDSLPLIEVLERIVREFD